MSALGERKSNAACVDKRQVRTEEVFEPLAMILEGEALAETAPTGLDLDALTAAAGLEALADATATALDLDALATTPARPRFWAWTASSTFVGATSPMDVCTAASKARRASSATARRMLDGRLLCGETVGLKPKERFCSHFTITSSRTPRPQHARPAVRRDQVQVGVVRHADGVCFGCLCPKIGRAYQ